MLNIWDVNWYLDLDLCPCDQHFVEFLQERKVADKVIYHFGSGGHHLIGRECARAKTGNVVLSITASPQEHAEYVKLLIAEPELAFGYICYFSDIYAFNGRLLPQFDLVTLFHLCEFRNEKNDVYGGLTDEQVLDAAIAQAKTGAIFAFYSGSFAWPSAKPIVERAAAAGKLAYEGDFKTLPIYRKV